MIRAVIFNLDGVLIRSDECHIRAWKALASEQGIPLNDDLYRRMRGMKRMDSLRILLKRAERKYTPGEMWALSARKNDLFNEFTQQLTLEKSIVPGAVETLRALRDMGVKTAVASSSENAGGILRMLKMDSLLDAIVDGGQIERGKPDPEALLIAARKLRVPTDQCLVVENTEAGLEAAKAAGMRSLSLVASGKDAAPTLLELGVAALIAREAEQDAPAPDQRPGDFKQ